MQSVDRALRILSRFDATRASVGVSELAVELGLHKSTVSRTLATLVRRGYVRRDGDRFAPGLELVRLGRLADPVEALAELARAPMERLAASTRETINLAVRDGDAVLHVRQIQGSHYLGVGDWTGRPTPLHATSTGKVLLAFGDGSLPAELLRITPRTIIDRKALTRELEQVRARGYAITREELEAGMCAAAGPVVDPSGICVAAVSVSGPCFRVSSALPRLGEKAAATAAEVSMRLGRSVAA
jgi:DNA-binding IclR family transcriptional regulator